MTLEIDTAFLPPAEPDEELLSSTLRTHIGNQGDQSESDSDPDEHSSENVFKDDRGKSNHRKELKLGVQQVKVKIHIISIISVSILLFYTWTLNDAVPLMNY